MSRVDESGRTTHYPVAVGRKPFTLEATLREFARLARAVEKHFRGSHTRQKQAKKRNSCLIHEYLDSVLTLPWQRRRDNEMNSSKKSNDYYFGSLLSHCTSKCCSPIWT